MVPFDSDSPERLYRLDFFHVWKVGVGRDVCGSTIVFLCQIGAFDLRDPGELRNIVVRLHRAHSNFKLWCAAENKAPALRSFTKSFLNAPTTRSSPWTNSKGSDATLLSMWLLWLLRLYLLDPPACVAPHARTIRLICQALDNALQMCEVIFQHGCFLPRVCASRLYLHTMVVCTG